MNPDIAPNRVELDPKREELAMHWFKNMKTSGKLLLGFGAMIVLLGLIIAVAHNAITSIRDSQKHFFEVDFRDALAVVELRADTNRQRTKILEMTLTTSRAQMDKLAQDIRSGEKEVEELLQGISARNKNDLRSLPKIAEMRKLVTAYGATQEGQMTLIFDGKAEEAGRLATGLQAERYESIRAIALKWADDELAEAQARLIESDQVAGRSGLIFAALGGLALLLSVIMVAVLNRLVSQPLVELSRLAERIASGDLTVNPAPEQRRDEIGVLSQTMARMAEDLRNQISELVEGANVLGSAASEIVASTGQLAASASESAAAVSETTTTVEEVRQTVKVASQKAKNVSDSAQKAAQISQNGRKSTEDIGAGMQRISQQMEAIAASMLRLSEQSQNIGQIIATVEDLAAQSNLLAVNAAIEAAKAGEHGKGFGVVAQEVKSLAEQSRQATNQVRAILGEIQKATAAAVMATEQGSKAVDTGARQTEVASESIQALAASVNEAAQAAIQIAASSQQQLVGVDQVVGAMESIKQASVQNVSGAKQLETAAHNLDELGQRLRQMVGRYKT